MLTAASKLWAGIPRDWKFAGGLVLATLAILTLVYCSGRSAGKDSVESDRLEAEVELQRDIGNATGNAADDRAAETIFIDESESEAHDAIDAAPDSKPSPAAVAHNCQRLLRAGHDIARYPACAGHRAVDRSQAGPDR